MGGGSVAQNVRFKIEAAAAAPADAGIIRNVATKMDGVPCDTSKVVGAIRSTAAAIRQRNGEKRLFSLGKFAATSCPGCGQAREKGKRYRHRLCSACHAGHPCTEAASQVMENLAVPSCAPGLVTCERVDPPLKPGKISRIRAWAPARNARGKRRNKATGEWFTPPTHDVALKIEGGPRLCGVAVSGCYPVVSAAGPTVLEKAVTCRVFLDVKSSPEEEAFSTIDRFPEILGNFPENSPDPDLPAWMASRPANRRVAMENALALYHQVGLTPKMAHFQSFVKSEKLPGWIQSLDGSRDLKMVPRLIQGPHDVTHVIAGPIMTAMLTGLKKQWHCHNPLYYAAGPPEDLHCWLNEHMAKRNRFAWCDFTAFDCTHSAESFAWVKKVYARFIPQSEYDFWKVLEYWQRPLAKCNYGLQYQARDMNASGRDDTALLNALLNGPVCWLALSCGLQGVELEDLKQLSDVTLGVVGDDMAAGFDGPIDKAIVERTVARFGFIPKLGSSEHLSDLVFLGSRPYKLPGEWAWGPTLGRRLYKAFWQIKPVGDPFAWVRGVAQQMDTCYAHVPVLIELARKVLELTEGGKVTTYVKENYNELAFSYGSSYTEETLNNLAEAYCRLGLECSAKDFVDLIASIRQIQQIPFVLDHWLLEGMVQVEDL